MAPIRLSNFAASTAGAVGKLLGTNDSRSSPDFLVAANESRVGTVCWVGDVIISKNAIYIFQEKELRSDNPLGVFIELLADLLFKRTTLRGGAYDDIPQDVRNHPAWPKRKSVSCPVLVVPQNTRAVMHHVKGTLSVRSVHGQTEFAIPHGRFGGDRIKAFLQANGWPMIWDGEQFNSTSPGEPLVAPPLRKPYVSYSMIAGGFFLAIAPMLFYVLPPIDRDLSSTLSLTGLIGGLLLLMIGWIGSLRGV